MNRFNQWSVISFLFSGYQVSQQQLRNANHRGRSCFIAKLQQRSKYASGQGLLPPHANQHVGLCVLRTLQEVAAGSG
jgi:hypothetical protein